MPHFRSVRLVVSSPAAALLACALSFSASAQEVTYRGEYFHNFETSAFTPDGSSDAWCVNAVEMKKAQVPGSKFGKAKVVIRGTLSPEGKYCNMGAYKHILKVHTVLEVKNLPQEPQPTSR
jgi:hypothetical protein